MDDLIKAIAKNDIVKFKQCFTEAMNSKINAKLTEERESLARHIFVKGEITESEYEVEDESEDDEDGSDEDEDGIVKVKTKV